MDIMRINSKEQEELVLKNKKLVYYIVNKLGVAPSDYEDIVSEAMIGLIQAAATFDKSKKTKFSTYAIRCINNAIFMHFRKEKKHTKVSSLDEPIEQNYDRDDILLGDVIEDTKICFVDEIENQEIVIKLISIILNVFTPRERLIMLYKITGMTQRDIAHMLNISRSYVSRIEGQLRNKLKSYLNESKQYKEVFFVEMVNDSYRIHFSSEDVSEFNKIFATLLKNLTSAEGLPDFRVSCNNKRIVVQIPADHAAFSFIAEIIKEIDNFNITYLSDKTALHSEKSTVMQKLEGDTSTAEDETAEDDAPTNEDETVVCDTSTAEDETTEDNSFADEDVSKGDVEPVKKSKNGQILSYILSKESSFTVKELKEKFPSFKQPDFGNAMNYAKKKGLIKSKARGVYVRVKDDN